MQTLYLEITVPRFVLTRLLGRFSPRVYFGPTAPLHLARLPDPPLPAPGWVRVRNRMCGVCGSDLHQIFLDASLDVAPAALPSHQRTYLGHEMVGEIVEVSGDGGDLAVGDRVVRWSRGDDCVARGRVPLCAACARGQRVLCEHASEPMEHPPVGGGFGDSFITPASTLVPVPDGLVDEQAIFAEPAAVAIHTAWRYPPQAGDKVLVLGCGTVGFLLMQVLQIIQPECDLTAVAQFPWQAEIARNFGARHVFMTDEDNFVRVADLTGARLYRGRGDNQMLLGGFDLIFDVVGIAPTLNNALRWTRAGGTVVLVGVNLHRMLLDMTPVWYQEVNLMGAVGHGVVRWAGEAISAFELAMQWMQEGQLQVAPLLTHRFPLKDYRRAFAIALDKRQARSIKVAFDLSNTM